VIIPAFDRPDFLAKAVRSVLDQTVADFEIIVVDDGSPNNLRPVLDALRDPRIACIRHESNQGEAGARNTGILHARGDYVAFLDDDDEWEPDKLRLQLEVFRRNADHVGCVYGGFVMVRAEDGHVISYNMPTARGDLSKELLRRNPVGIPSTVMLTRECLERVGLCDRNIAYGVDHDLWIRVSQTHRFDFVPAVVTRYSVHRDQLSQDEFCVARGHLDMLEKYAGRLPPDSRQDAVVYFDLARQMCLRGRAAEGRRLFRKAMRIRPLGLRSYVYFALSFGGPSAVSQFQTRAARALKRAPTRG
jgi:glycosyltransferase involved in cell wall biosynthesis